MELSLLNLFLVLLAGWMGGGLAARIGYPPVLGELLTGIVLGPPILGLLQADAALLVLAEVGVLLMMLYVGMEIDPKELGKASWGGFLAAVGGFVTPFVLAYFTVQWFGGTVMGSIFVGIAAGVTSLTTKSRILVDLKLLDTRIAHVMMAGALIADSISLVIFAGVLGVLEVGSLELATVGLVTLKVVLFFGFTALLGLKVFPPLGRRLTQAGLTDRTFHFTLVLLLAVAFGELAHLAGLHAILGAFIAGLFLRDNVLGKTLSHDLMGAVRDASIGFLAPIFFVSAGFAVSFSVFRTDLGLFLAIMAVATFGKIFGTAGFYLFSGNGWREGLAVGAGMNGRGAVEIIVAGIALEMGLISQEIFSILVFMAIFTTATVPVFLKWGTEWLRGRGELVRSQAERLGTLILGAGPTARALARALGSERPVWLVDNSRERCSLAEREGFQTACGNVLQEQVLSEAGAAYASSVAALIPNTEVNTLAAQMARNVFLVPEIHLVQQGRQGSGRVTSMEHLHASTLFGGPVSLEEWDHRISRSQVEEASWKVGGQRPAAALFDEMQDDQPRLPLVVQREGARIPFHGGLLLEPGDEVFGIQQTRAPIARDRFDRLAAECPLLDLEAGVSVPELFSLVAAALAPRFGIPQKELRERLEARERAGSTILSPGLAIPHLLLEGDHGFDMVIVRCREGVAYPHVAEPVHAVFALAGTAEERNFHLRALSAIAQIAQDEEFEEAWLAAAGPDDLRRVVLDADRRRF